MSVAILLALFCFVTAAVMCAASKAYTHALVLAGVALVVYACATSMAL